MSAFFSRRTPFIRLLVFFCAGILLQWYFPLPPGYWIICIAAGLLLVSSLFFIPLRIRYRFAFLGIAGAALAFAALGAVLVWHKDIRHDPSWVGHYLDQQDSVFMVTIREPLIEKSKSYKAEAAVNYFDNNQQKQPVTGKLIIYFQKDSSLLSISTGSTLLFKKPIQEIRNAGNPGGFDYKRYSLFNGITHQVYLQPGEYVLLPEKKTSSIAVLLEKVQQYVLRVIREYIPGARESGLAEALLIGYKNDLDKTFVQSYTNTGVVHIIAISGLHLGLIYWLLRLLFRLLPQRRYMRWLRPLLIISGLWFFSLLAGAQPSILRAAVMFSCIVIAESLSKKGSIYNTLAFSAMLLLCVNPFWLWDVGFQLSYIAVLSIILFMKPVYGLFYFKNKVADFLWQMNAVTIAAQILTLPVSIYHFHQFPGHFLLSNFLAVPLSSIILLGLIALCMLSVVPLIATWTGIVLSWLIKALNGYIAWIERLPGSLWDGLQINMIQVLCLYAAISFFSMWWLKRVRHYVLAGFFCTCCFALLRAYSFYEATVQHKIIVYNTPKLQAIDFIWGRELFFAGDSSLLRDDFARNFLLKPSRMLHRTPLNGQWLGENKRYIVFGGKKILWLNKAVSYQAAQQPTDLLILSGNPKLYLQRLLQTIQPGQVVIDASVPAWKAAYWKQDCAKLGIACHDVTENGAFVMNLR